MLWPTPRSAYLHVPFCRHRCGYCNFSLVAGRDDLISRFLAAIDRELESIAEHADCVPKLDTLFVGGGTPTHLPIASLERFLEIVRNRVELNPAAEWSMEANPEDLSGQKLDLMRAMGVTRLSLGIQSFDDRKLKTLERRHAGNAAADIVHRAAEVFTNLSIDLIFAAPGETVPDWKRDLQIATALPIQHVSTYALTFEKGTSFWTRKNRGALTAVDESNELEMYDLSRDLLSHAGLEHYEISNFARSGGRCRHNLAYWQGQGWYAAGPGAASFIDGHRRVNHRSTTTYLKRIERGLSPVAESEWITDQQAARESAAFGVRMIDGIDLADLKRQTGICIESLCARELDDLHAQRLIRHEQSRIKLTERGIHFADTVASAFLG